MDREKIRHFTKDELLTRLDWLAAYAYTHNDLLTACIARDSLALLKEQENEIDTLKTLLLGYETGAIKGNN